MTAKRKPRRLLILVPTLREAQLLFGRRKPRAPVALVGVGLAQAGATAARLFAQLRPDAALLVGIAGTLAPRRLPIGGLLLATRVACDGIGAGEGRRFVAFGGAPLALAASKLRGFDSPAVVRGELLSVAAAAERTMVAARRRRHPRALAEEMEGYAVALAARAVQLPLTILRAVSNVAGDRDHRRWRLREPLVAARGAVAAWIAAVRGGALGAGRASALRTAIGARSP